MKAAGANPYPHKFEVSISVVDYVKTYGGLSDGEHLKDVVVNLAGIVVLHKDYLKYLFVFVSWLELLLS